MRLTAALQADLRQLLAAELRAVERGVTSGVRRATDGLKAELHGPLDELLDALEEDAVGLEATHPTVAKALEHATRLLASIGI